MFGGLLLLFAGGLFTWSGVKNQQPRDVVLAALTGKTVDARPISSSSGPTAITIGPTPPAATPPGNSGGGSPDSIDHPTTPNGSPDSIDHRRLGSLAGAVSGQPPVKMYPGQR